MRFRQQRLIAVALAGCCALLSCSTPQRVHVQPKGASSVDSSSDLRRDPLRRLDFRVTVSERGDAYWVEQLRRAQKLIDALKSERAAANGPPFAPGQPEHPSDQRLTPVAVAAAPSSIAGVMACIRAHESGNYTEHSHPQGSSGAYQYQPGTWRAWSARAGYPGYDLAYEAPAAVQDAVTAYALTHGGAHNWDPRFGNDPCTVGLP